MRMDEIAVIRFSEISSGGITVFRSNLSGHVAMTQPGIKLTTLRHPVATGPRARNPYTYILCMYVRASKYVGMCIARRAYIPCDESSRSIDERGNPSLFVERPKLLWQIAR